MEFVILEFMNVTISDTDNVFRPSMAWVLWYYGYPCFLEDLSVGRYSFEVMNFGGCGRGVNDGSP